MAGLRTALILIALAAAPAARAAEHIVTVPSRPGVTVDFAVTEPAGPAAAAVLLLGGGEGNLSLWRGPLKRGRNFLVRTRNLFAAQGLLVLSVDVPSDLRDTGLQGKRDRPEHRDDIAAVVKWVRGQTTAPVWLVGNSTGTISAAYLAAALPVDGAVLTSSFTEPSKLNRATVLDAPLDRVRVPVLIVHSRDDECPYTPLDGDERIRSHLRSSPKVDIRLLEGGKPPRSGPCDALAGHGFFGIERETVAAIADWIKAQSRR